MKNLITDIEGILVGCAEDHKFSTGVTVLSGPSPFTAAVDVRGGGAGTRETEILKLEAQLEESMLLFYREVQHLD